MFLPGRRILRFEVAAEGSDRVTGIVRNLEDFSIPERLSRVCWDDDRVMAIFRGEAREIETKAHDPSPVISDLQHEKELKSDSDSSADIFSDAGEEFLDEMDGITDEKSNDRVYFDAKKNASEKNTAVTFPSQGKSILEVVKSFVKGSEKGKQTLFSYSSEDEDSLIEDTGKLRRLEAVDEDEGDYGFQMEGLGDSDDEQESKSSKKSNLNAEFQKITQIMSKKSDKFDLKRKSVASSSVKASKSQGASGTAHKNQGKRSKHK